MHRSRLGLRVVIPVKGFQRGGSLGLEVLGTGIGVPAQQVSKNDSTNFNHVKPLREMRLYPDVDLLLQSLPGSRTNHSRARVPNFHGDFPEHELGHRAHRER